ncbi:hypothetical protein [Halobacteriovorax sp. HLS]|uniref:hypothetical protein n=1 Tax=Halobacteriovorax sp. HLS TaxID=2234000 RepID=UPI000FDB4382|nr:hypothetical protein [Halobacteriovorax sp. HLS]
MKMVSKINLIFTSFLLSYGAHALESSPFFPTFNNSIRATKNFNPFIIGTGLNYQRDDNGVDTLSPSISWMTKYTLSKKVSLKSNLEATFVKDEAQKNIIISSQADFYFAIKTSRELEVSLKAGAYFTEDGQKSLSYGVEFEHNSKLLRKLNIRSVYVGIENIPSLEASMTRLFSGVRFSL